MSKDTGGSAFPVNESHHCNPDGGMTLRDYFAAKIVCSLISVGANGQTFGVGHPNVNANFAMAAYSISDAMLAERAK